MTDSFQLHFGDLPDKYAEKGQRGLLGEVRETLEQNDIEIKGYYWDDVSLYAYWTEIGIVTAKAYAVKGNEIDPNREIVSCHSELIEHCLKKDTPLVMFLVSDSDQNEVDSFFRWSVDTISTEIVTNPVINQKVQETEKDGEVVEVETEMWNFYLDWAERFELGQ